MAQGEDDGGEKTHEPTPQKLEEARRKGDVPKSTDLAVAAAYLGLLAALIAVGAGAARQSGEAMAGVLATAHLLEGRVLGPGGGAVSARIVLDAAAPLLPLFLAPMAASLLAFIAQRAVVAAPEKLAPKPSRISLVQNAKNKFGPTGLVEFAKATVKLVAISAVLAVFLLAETDRMAGLVRADPVLIGPEMMRIGVALLSVIAVIAAFIAAADVLWQRFDHARKNRMSHQELKEEHKRTEGDPHLKSERQTRGRKIATNRMLLDVPEADVVLTNPTHVAVALKWSRAPGSAPVCVAKGEDALAAAIREVAAEHGVPIRSDPPTARAINATVEIGEEIRPDHYQAVAAAIRYAERMRNLARERGWGR
jgi:flagellar biosynthetic protein FlhB